MSDEENLTKVRMALPRYLLRGVSGPSFGKTFAVYRTTVIGRHSECTVTLDGEGLSRRHAELRLEGGKLLAKDLGSANGTFINDERIEEGELKTGDELRLDTMRFLVQSPNVKEALDSPAEPVAPPKPVSWVPWAVSGTLILALGVLALLYYGFI